MNSKTRRGRPPKSSDRLKNKVVIVRLEQKEKKAFQDAAQLAGIPLSIWIRERLRWAATKELQGADRQVAFLQEVFLTE